MNDECRMMNEMNPSHTPMRLGEGHHSLFLIPHFGGGGFAGWGA
jgi:hypothetical protein